MRIRTHVPIQQIYVDKKLPLNPKTLNLIDFLKDGGQFQPVHLQMLPNGKLRLRQGRHRLVAAKMLGWPTVLCRYSTKPSRKGPDGTIH
jgi:hypothetical protein